MSFVRSERCHVYLILTCQRNRKVGFVKKIVAAQNCVVVILALPTRPHFLVLGPARSQVLRFGGKYIFKGERLLF